jgi:TonB-linked SusC/RagA family outer membrane protein
MKKVKKYIAVYFGSAALLALAIAFPAAGQTPSPAETAPETTLPHESMRNRIDGGTTPQSELTGAIGSIDIDDMSKFPSYNLSNALAGQAAGLVVRSQAEELTAGSSINIRGLHAFSNNGAIIVVDGMERPMADLFIEEIESIEILKDAPAKAIFGPAAANGVVLITTRRGVEGRRAVKLSAEYGLSPAGFMADWLDSYNYATLYNEARANDGMAPLYTQDQLEGYKNSSGASDLLYPDVDHRGNLLRNTMDYTRVSFDANGGGRNILYAINAGFMSGNGLEKVGKRLRVDKLNLRANLDIKINDFVKIKADMAGRMWIQNRGVVWGTDVFDRISKHRPNEYPFTIDPQAIGVVPNDDGVPTFGGSELYPNNLYADMAYGGYVTERYTTSQANLGAEFNLNRVARGLSAEAYVTLDNYNYTSQELRNTYATYDVNTYLNGAGEERMQTTLLRRQVLNKDVGVNGYALQRTFGWRANINYRNTFGRSTLSAVAAARYMKAEFAGLTQDRINSIYSLRLGYDYDKRYFVEAILAGVGSNKYTRGNKYFLSPVVSAGWLISNEEFMSSSAIDHLKLKASYGVMGYAASTEFNLHSSAWRENGTMGFGERNTAQEYLISLIRIGNPDLEWESSAELNIGVEWAALENRLYGEVNWFNEHHRNIVGTDGSIYTDMQGDYAVPVNMGETRNRGVDLSAAWRNRSGDFSYDVGLNFLYSGNKIIHCGELQGIEEARRMTGRSSGAIYGLDAIGLFGRDIPLSGAPSQRFGHYQEGDIAYADKTGDGIVDVRDMVMLGNQFPATVWGLKADLRYRGWGLYILATAETGASVMMTGAWFQNHGTMKYSTLALDRYHPTANPGGTHPRLTTTTAANNTVVSNFWMDKADFLRLRNVELSHIFRFDEGPLGNIRLFLRGTNIATLTGVKNVDPQMPVAGILGYPAYSTYTLGLTATF